MLGFSDREIASGVRGSWRSRLALLTCAGIASVTQAAWAAEMEEIMITATKRGEQALQEVPIAVQAFTGDQIRRQVALELIDLAPQISSLIVQDLGPGDRKYIIRGVNSTATAAVGVYYDETPITARSKQDGGGRQAAIELVDIDRIEVLKGPQGTLYGASSSAGTIRYIPNRPDPTGIDATVGSFVSTTEDGGENYHVDGMFNLPVVEDVLALRGVGWYTNEDGFVDNILLGNDDINDNEVWGLKLGGEWLINEDFTWSAFTIYQDRDVGGTSRQMPIVQDTLATNRADPAIEPSLTALGFGQPSGDERTTQSYTQTPWDEETTLVGTKVEWGIGPGNLLASVNWFKREVKFRFDSSPICMFFGGCPQFAADTFQPQEREVTSGEIRWASDLSGPVQFVVGGFVSNEDKDFEVQVVESGSNGNPVAPFSPGDPATIFGRTKSDDLDQYALFGEVEWYINDQLSVLGGIRYYDFEIDSSNVETQPFFAVPSLVPVKFNVDGDEVTYKANLTYRFTDQALGYATYSEGYRPGGTNDIAFIAPGDPPPPPGFGPDKLKNYELGWKTEWLDQSLTFNGALFYIDWEDLQTATFDPNSPFNVVRNAGEAEITGVEFDLTATPIEGLYLTLTGSIQNAEYNDDVPGSDPATPFARDGDDIPNVPDYQFGAVGEYTWQVFGDKEASVRADWSYLDDRITAPNDSSSNIDLDSFHLVGLRAGIETDYWTAALFVRNLFDEDESAYDGINTPQDPRAIVTARPRTIGVQFEYRVGGRK